MKSKIVNTSLEHKERTRPWLGVADNGVDQVVVLFTKYQEGTIVWATSESQKESIGVFYKYWYMPDFTEFKGQVILSND